MTVPPPATYLNCVAEYRPHGDTGRMIIIRNVSLLLHRKSLPEYRRRELARQRAGSEHVLTTIDGNIGSGDECRFVRRQVGHQPGDFLGLAKA